MFGPKHIGQLLALKAFFSHIKSATVNANPTYKASTRWTLTPNTFDKKNSIDRVVERQRIRNSIIEEHQCLPLSISVMLWCRRQTKDCYPVEPTAIASAVVTNTDVTIAHRLL